MKVDQFIDKPGAWLLSDAQSDVVVSSRVRLARNVSSTSFPSWASQEERERVWKTLEPILSGLSPLERPFISSMDKLRKLDRQILFERHLISREHAEKGRGSGVAIRPDETVSVMVNEEDHVRLQVLRPGLDLVEAWELATKIDSELEEHVRFSFSRKLGYLRAV